MLEKITFRGDVKDGREFELTVRRRNSKSENLIQDNGAQDCKTGEMAPETLPLRDDTLSVNQYTAWLSWTLSAWGEHRPKTLGSFGPV